MRSRLLILVGALGVAASTWLPWIAATGVYELYEDGDSSYARVASSGGPVQTFSLWRATHALDVELVALGLAVVAVAAISMRCSSRTIDTVLIVLTGALLAGGVWALSYLGPSEGSDRWRVHGAQLALAGTAAALGGLWPLARSLGGAPASGPRAVVGWVGLILGGLLLAALAMVRGIGVDPLWRTVTVYSASTAVLGLVVAAAASTRQVGWAAAVLGSLGAAFAAPIGLEGLLGDTGNAPLADLALCVVVAPVLLGASVSTAARQSAAAAGG